MNERTSGWQHVPALDGLRAFAVAAVVLFHFWPDTFGGGFIGVDVFFVISGFLITGILQAEHRSSGRVSLSRFWWRRIRRLVPAVLVLVSVTSVTLWAIGRGSARQFGDSIGALTWTMNWVELAYRDSAVWVSNPNSVLEHLWSLSIEEQFYLVWPVVAVVMMQRSSSRRLHLALIATGIVASAWAMWAIGLPTAYVRTDARAFELLAGAFLAVWGWVPARRVGALLALVGMGVLIGYVFLAGSADPWMYPWGFLGVTAASGCVVAGLLNAPTALTSFALWPVVAHVGTVSYGIYLWHIPVLRVLSPARVGLAGVPLTMLRFGALAIIVELSFRFVETPIRNGSVRFGGRALLGGYAVTLVALIPMMIATHEDLARQWDVTSSPPSATGRPKVAIVGDLPGAIAGDGLSGDDRFAVWSIVDLGCPTGLEGELWFAGEQYVVDEFCRHWPQRWRRAIRRFDPEVVIIGAGLWDTFELRIDGDVVSGDRLVDAYRRILDQQIDEAAGDNRRLFVVEVDDWTNLLQPADRGDERRMTAFDAYNTAIEQATSAHPAVEVLTVSGDPTVEEMADQVSRRWPDRLSR